tara:strand:+ start:38 stop:259 length:222 start_codon:yes stop_codon:yes gene_type:complete
MKLEMPQVLGQGPRMLVMFKTPLPVERVALQDPSWTRYVSPPKTPANVTDDDNAGIPPLSSSDARHTAEHPRP